MTFYNHIESVRSIAIDLTNGRKWRGASDKTAVFDALDAARREYMRLSDENAALRELVHEALLFGNERSYQEIRYRLKQQARELGIEADE